ncbi:MAG: hypothetical protein ACTSSL_11370, partial [Candidatus Heimdallarchaeaceae archaeon]
LQIVDENEQGDITVYFNDFINNSKEFGFSQAADNGNSNCFSNNYWSDHSNQDENNDNIADEPYLIDGSANNFDYYPIITIINNRTQEHYLIPPRIVSPNGGEILSGTARIEWREAKDSFGKDIIYDVYYSRDKGISWNLLSEGAVVPLLFGLMAEDMSDKPFEIKNNEDTETGTTTITFDLPGWTFLVVIFSVVGVSLVSRRKKR